MITKRQLGSALLAAGLLAGAAMMVVDRLGAGGYDGIGPAQKLVLIVAGVVTFVGATLIPLGKRPA